MFDFFFLADLCFFCLVFFFTKGLVCLSESNAFFFFFQMGNIKSVEGKTRNIGCAKKKVKRKSTESHLNWNGSFVQGEKTFSFYFCSRTKLRRTISVDPLQWSTQSICAICLFFFFANGNSPSIRLNKNMNLQTTTTHNCAQYNQNTTQVLGCAWFHFQFAYILTSFKIASQRDYYCIWIFNKR